MKLCVFVLHLIRATGRRDNAHSLLDTCGLPGDIWPAVDGSTMSSTELSAIVGAQLFAPTYPFGLKSGEVGCFLSHRQIWAEMQMRDADAALIIEDDAAIDLAIFPAALRLASANIADLGYIQLQTRPPQGATQVIDTSGACQLTVPRLAGLRTTAQVVSRDAAAHLLKLSDRMDRPVDTFVQSHWHTGLRPAMIHPSGISDIADQLDGSTIQSGRKSPMEKLTREIQRGIYRNAIQRHSRHSTAPEQGGLADV